MEQKFAKFLAGYSDRFVPSLLGSKNPLIRWSIETWTYERMVLRHQQSPINWAWLIDHSGILILDVDIKGKAERRKEWESYLESSPYKDLFQQTVRVVTPTGGYHYYFLSPDPSFVERHIRCGPKLGMPDYVDLLASDMIYIPPSKSGENGRYYRHDSGETIVMAPKEWLDAVGGVKTRHRFQDEAGVPTKTDRELRDAGALSRNYLERFLREHKRVRSITSRGDELVVSCPYHDDRKPSLYIRLTPHKLLCFCHSCDSKEPVVYPKLVSEYLEWFYSTITSDLPPLITPIIADRLIRSENQKQALFGDLLEPGTLTILVGHSKEYKSTFARNVAAAVSSGTDYLGYSVRKGGVLFIEYEEPLSYSYERISNLPYDPSNLFFLHRSSKDGYGSVMSIRKYPFRTLKRYIEQYGITLVVIDSIMPFLRTLATSDEYPKGTFSYTSYDDIHELLNDYLKSFAEEVGVAVLAITHRNKGRQEMHDSIIGSRGFDAAADSIWHWSRTQRTSGFRGEDLDNLYLLHAVGRHEEIRRYLKANPATGIVYDAKLERVPVYDRPVPKVEEEPDDPSVEPERNELPDEVTVQPEAWQVDPFMDDQDLEFIERYRSLSKTHAFYLASDRYDDDPDVVVLKKLDIRDVPDELMPYAMNRIIAVPKDQILRGDSVRLSRFALDWIYAGYREYSGMLPKEVPHVSFDIEATDLSYENGRIIAVSVLPYDRSDPITLVDREDELRLIKFLDDYLVRYDWIVGYNIFKFDLPYLIARARANDYTLKFLEGSSKEEMNFRAGGYEEKVEAIRFANPKRMCLDLYLLALRYNEISGGRLGSLSLRNVYNKLTRNEIGEFDDKSKMADWSDEAIAEQVTLDVRMTESVFEQLTMMSFGLKDYVPRPIKLIFYGGAGSNIDWFLIAKYLSYGKAVVNLPKEKIDYEGAVIELRRAGRYEPVYKIDVVSMYPNIIMRNGIHPRGDYLGLLPKVLTELVSERITAKRNYKETGEPRHEATQLALKSVINSAYGMMGSTVLVFSDYEAASKVTETGRSILLGMEKQLESLGATVIELDTDGIYFWTDQTELIERLPEIFNTQFGYEFEVDRYDVGVFLKRKTYILKSGDKIEVYGSALRGRQMPGYTRRWIDRIANALVANEPIEELVEAMLHDWETCDPYDFLSVQRIQADTARKGQVCYKNREYDRQTSKFVVRTYESPPDPDAINRYCYEDLPIAVLERFEPVLGSDFVLKVRDRIRNQFSLF